MDLLNAVAGASARGGGHGSITRALEAVRTHLGMEVAYVSEFVGDLSVFRAVDAPGLEALIKPGDSRSLDDVYCRHILAGRMPELIPDTAEVPLAMSMPITAAVPIGAHVSVPLRLGDGSVYGMFCCLSPYANKSLNPRDLAMMRAFADFTVHQIEHDLAAGRDAGEKLARIDAVIAEKAFAIMFQPIFDFFSDRPIGFEALSRFAAEPQRSPDKWFAEAAEIGRGTALELAAIEAALAGAAALPAPAYVAVNASPTTILDPAFPALVGGFDPARLVLEITEHAPVYDYPGLVAILRTLRATGIRLAVDDAGAGYSGLQHIVQLQPDIIKLDMSLTRNVHEDAARRALASALVFYARETGCQILAEGIETDEELFTLKCLGIAKGQGYYLGRPVDLETAVSLLHGTAPAAARLAG